MAWMPGLFDLLIFGPVILLVVGVVVGVIWVIKQRR